VNKKDFKKWQTKQDNLQSEQ